MNYTHLGRTGLKVSRLCLGTMNFGDVTDEKTSARILDEALEAGINFIDTADVYGTNRKQRCTASPVDGQRATRNRCGAGQNPIAGRSRRSVYRKSV